MTVQFSGAEVGTFGGKMFLMLELPDYESKQVSQKFVSEKKDRKYVAEIKEHRNKRSQEANAYCWTLINKLAEAVGRNPVDIYREHVREVGKFSQYLMSEEAYESFITAWEKNHIGRFSVVLGGSKDHDGFIWVAAFLGSSDFDTKEMSRMIENIIQDAKAVGVEHLSPDKIEEMLTAWGNR